MRPTDALTIGQLSQRTGIAISAIRYYETQGLIHPDRNAGGQRQFRRADIRRLSFVRIAQQFSFSIDQIGELLQMLPQARTPTKADWGHIAVKFRKDLDARIETLTTLRDNLDGCIGCGCLSLEKCKLYNPNDIARHKGSGPRYLMGDKSEVAS